MLLRVVKKKWLVGLRTEIILNVTILMGAALLGGGILLTFVTEKALLTQRGLGLSDAMSILAQSVAADQAGQPLNEQLMVVRVETMLKRFSGTTPLLSWGLVDRDLILVGSPKMSGSMSLDVGSLRHVKKTASAVCETHVAPSWLLFEQSAASSATVTVPLLRADVFVGALQARFSLAGMARPIMVARRLLVAYAVFYGLIFIVFGSLMLNRTLVRPIRRLMVSTRLVADGRLEEDVELGGPREIVELGEAFNSMVASLRSSRERTEKTLDSLQHSNQELQKTQNELIRSEKMASVGHLAAGMAHEIGNPLGAVVGYLEMLKETLEDPLDKDLAIRSLSEVSRIDSLVRELLDYAAPDTGGEKCCRPLAVLYETVDILQHQGALDGMELVTSSLPEMLPKVSVSAEKLLQVFINLIVNARDACESEGTISFAAKTEADQVLLTIADRGPGMSQELQGNIFDPFYSTKATGKGRGLGLFVCSQILHDAGGRIEVASIEGQGTTFTLYLPVVSENAENAERA